MRTCPMCQRTFAPLNTSHTYCSDPCSQRAKRWRRAGDGPPPVVLSDEERFWRQVAKQSDGCWDWIGTLSTRGYGRFSLQDRTLQAHRVAYEWLNGPIPDGKELDHLCRNRACVNPDHLEPVTTRENLLRGTGLTAQNARKTTCPAGHPYSFVRDGARRCGECRRAENRRYHAAHRTELNARKRALAAALAERLRSGS